MAQEKFKRKLATIPSADVTGCGGPMGEEESAIIKTLEAYKNGKSKSYHETEGLAD